MRIDADLNLMIVKYYKQMCCDETLEGVLDIR